MMTVFHLTSAALGVFIILAAGCAPSPTKLDPAFGESVAEFKKAQILNPEVQGIGDPVEGFQGQAADTTIKQYEKSFIKKRRPTPNVGVLLSPSGTSSGAGS